MPPQTIINRIMPRQVPVDTAWDFLKVFDTGEVHGGRHLALGSGLELVFLDFMAPATLEHIFLIDQAPLIFSFHLAGHGKGIITHSSTQKEEVYGDPGLALLSYTPGVKCQTRAIADQTYKILNLYISPVHLHRLLGGDLGQVPPDMLPLLEHGCQSPFNFSCKISPATRMVLDQIYGSAFKGGMARLFLESKAMELVVRQLWEFARLPGNGPAPALSSRDRKQICRARDILIRNLENPPCLKSLAREAGLNDTKLKRGFRQVFGTTVFGYLREFRMARSKTLLDSGNFNVDQTAQTLGFHDTAHFIRRFKQRFGTTPGTYIRQAREVRAGTPESGMPRL